MQTHAHSKPNWRHSPRRVWLRRATFQVHLWLGLLLTLYAIVIGVSGSALVFREAIERHVAPQRFTVQAGGAPMPLATMVNTIQANTPRWRVASLKSLQPGQPVTFTLRPERGMPSANYRYVVFDPYKGRVVADYLRFSGVLGFLANLHFYLLAGKTGLLINGAMALGLTVLCLSGLVVWWPGVRRAGAALLFHRRRTWQRLNYDLHAVTGFWVCLPLLLLCVTGAYFAFPDATARVVDTLFLTRSVAEAKPRAALPSTLAPLTLNQAYLRATQLLPANAPVGYFAMPAKPGGTYYATGYYRNTAPYSQLVSIRFDGRSGELLSHEDTRELPRSRRLIQYFFALHFGSFGGEGAAGSAIRLLWVLVGLSPAVLACTGVVLFAWRKRHLWRGRST